MVDDKNVSVAPTMKVVIPRAELGPGYRTNRVDLHLSEKQRRGLNRLFMALVGGRAAVPHKIENGQFVQTPQMALRWLLEQVEDVANAPTET